METIHDLLSAAMAIDGHNSSRLCSVGYVQTLPGVFTLGILPYKEFQ